MKDFIYHNSTKVYFGKGYMEHLPEELSKYGKRVLLVYGGGSIKRNGLYDLVMNLLKKHDFEIEEVSGVEPNPRHTFVNNGVRIAREKHSEVVLAVGGGSVIDAAKAIAGTTLSETDDTWELIKNKVWMTKALPLVVVLTNAATGSEMDKWAVISNLDTKEKISLAGDALLPKVVFENPEFSYSVPTYQTACGAFDIFNHVLDNYYFAKENTFDLILELQEAVMRNVVKWTPVALKNPNNYEARANLMWASSIALNTMLDGGCVHSNACHKLEHELSAYYDITHGHGLAIVTPRWMRYILDDEMAPYIYRFGQKVFGVKEGLTNMEGANKAIEALEEFCFETLNLPSRLSDLGIDDKYFVDMATHMCKRNNINMPRKLEVKDVINILHMCL